MAKKPNKKNQKHDEKGKEQDDKSEEQIEKGPVKKDKKPNSGHYSRIPDKLAEAKAKGMVSCICLHNMDTSHGLTILATKLGRSHPRNS